MIVAYSTVHLTTAFQRTYSRTFTVLLTDPQYQTIAYWGVNCQRVLRTRLHTINAPRSANEQTYNEPRTNDEISNSVSAK